MIDLPAQGRLEGAQRKILRIPQAPGRRVLACLLADITLFAVVDDGPQDADLLSRDVWSAIDDDPRDFLLAAASLDAGLGFLDHESLLGDDLLQEGEEPNHAWILAGESEIVGIPRILEVHLHPHPGETPIEAAANQIRKDRAGRCSGGEGPLACGEICEKGRHRTGITHGEKESEDTLAGDAGEEILDVQLHHNLLPDVPPTVCDDGPLATEAFGTGTEGGKGKDVVEDESLDAFQFGIRSVDGSVAAVTLGDGVGEVAAVSGSGQTAEPIRAEVEEVGQVGRIEEEDLPLLVDPLAISGKKIPGGWGYVPVLLEEHLDGRAQATRSSGVQGDRPVLFQVKAGEGFHEIDDLRFDLRPFVDQPQIRKKPFPRLDRSTRHSPLPCIV